jgi:hypothetical protein
MESELQVEDYCSMYLCSLSFILGHAVYQNILKLTVFINKGMIYFCVLFYRLLYFLFFGTNCTVGFLDQ